MYRNTLLITATLVCTTFASAQPDAQKTAEVKAAQSKYDTLKVRVINGDLKIDWRAFRVSAQDARLDADFDSTTAHQAAQAEYERGNFAESLKLALSIEQYNLADPIGHLDAYAAYRQLGKSKEMKAEEAISNAIFQSIATSGTGKSPATAFFTVSPHEDYTFLALVLGLQIKHQELVRQGGHAYDKLLAVDKAGKEVTVWCNTDTDMNRMDASFKALKD